MKQKFMISGIFIKDTKIENEECEKIMAHITRSLYDYFLFSDDG